MIWGSDLVVCGSLRKPAEARSGACGSYLNPYREIHSFRRGFAKVCGSVRKLNGITRSVRGSRLWSRRRPHTRTPCVTGLKISVKHLRKNEDICAAVR